MAVADGVCDNGERRSRGERRDHFIPKTYT